MSGEGKVVCVTGGSGYIASWLIKLLLQRCYSVRATVRSPNDVKKNAHLLALDGAKERLTLLKSDLLEEGSFDAAVDGCDGVFHTASPVSFAITDPHIEMIDPAVKGTLNVLKSCAKAASVKRIIITSSFATFPYTGNPLTSDVVVDETWFSDPEFCKQHQRWYEMGKTLAEQAAWKFAEENLIDLITLHPVFVIGPILQSTPNMSVEVILNLVNGAEEYPDSYYCSVDVRDVAVAHLQAFEIPSASGRYCLIESDPHFSDILKILHQHYPNLQLPQKCGLAGKPFKTKYKVSAERTRDLGIDFIPLEASLKDTVESLKEKGFFSTLM